ncbi:MAG: hypothetical protein L0G81_13065, partial [Ewingella sp.]|nr:hypothetical protein [Ewingella sp.]
IVILFVGLDRANKLTWLNSRLLTLGAALAPLTVAIIDSLFAWITTAENIKIQQLTFILLIAFFSTFIVTGIAWILMELFYRKHSR